MWVESRIGQEVSGRFGENVVQHIEESVLRRDTFFSLLASSLDRIVERFGVDVVFIPHVTLGRVALGRADATS